LTGTASTTRISWPAARLPHVRRHLRRGQRTAVQQRPIADAAPQRGPLGDVLPVRHDRQVRHDHREHLVLRGVLDLQEPAAHGVHVGEDLHHVGGQPGGPVLLG
jgi:hypothetical protein